MVTRRAHFRQSDATKALKAAVAAGLRPSGYCIDPITGRIDVTFDQEPARPSNSFDAIQGSAR